MNEHSAERDTEVAIYREDVNGHSTNKRQADEFRPVPTKMVGPYVVSRVVEPHDLATRRIEARDIRSLVMIASEARESQVGFNGPALMLNCNNVVDLEVEPIDYLRQLAILAPPARARPTNSSNRLSMRLGGWCRAQR